MKRKVKTEIIILVCLGKEANGGGAPKTRACLCGPWIQGHTLRATGRGRNYSRNHLEVSPKGFPEALLLFLFFSCHQSTVDPIRLSTKMHDERFVHSKHYTCLRSRKMSPMHQVVCCKSTKHKKCNCSIPNSSQWWKAGRSERKEEISRMVEGGTVSHPLPFYGNCSLCSLGPQGFPSFRVMTSSWLHVHKQNHHALASCPVGGFNACVFQPSLSLILLQAKVEMKSRKESQGHQPYSLPHQWADSGRKKSLFSLERHRVPGIFLGKHPDVQMWAR